MRSSTRSHCHQTELLYPVLAAENPRNIAPLTTGAQDVHQAVHHRTHVGAALAAARPRRRNERRDNRPLLVREVARVPQMITIVSRSVFLRPHRQPRESDCLLSITNNSSNTEVSSRTLRTGMQAIQLNDQIEQGLV